jgi:tripartite-type tricarboxylate transporter receptor subunit TctC
MRRRAVLSAGLLAAPGLVAAQTLRPIRMIVPFPPGGATDALSRIAAGKLQDKLGQTVVVENRSGGNGVVGGMALIQSQPDGLTIMASASIHAVLHRVLRSIPFDPINDFTPIARTAKGPLLFVLDPRRPQRSVAEVAAAAHANPRDWTFTTSSLGSAGHLAAIAFGQAAQADILMVPQRSSSAGLTDVAAGNISLMFDPVLAPLPMVRGGQLRALAITNERRIPAAPEIPTMAEAGMPDFVFHSWYGVWGPKGMPAAMVERMNRALAEGMREPDVMQRLAALAFEPVDEDAAAFDAAIRQEEARGTQLLRSVNFEAQ